MARQGEGSRVSATELDQSLHFFFRLPFTSFLEIHSQQALQAPDSRGRSFRLSKRQVWIILSVYFVSLKASEESSAASTPRNSETVMGRGEEARGGREEDLEYLKVRFCQTYNWNPFLNFNLEAETCKRRELGEHEVERKRSEETPVRGRISSTDKCCTSVLF